MRYFKNLVLFFLFIFALAQTNFAFATDLYKNYCPNEPYDIASTPTRVTQSMLGMNFIAKQVAAKEIKKNIKSFAKGHISVKVDSYSATDAQQGKFKRFTIKGKNLILFSSIYLSEFYAKTMCNFIHLNLNDNPATLTEPMAVDFTAKFSEADLNKILQTSAYKKYFMSVKYSTKELVLFQLTNPKISLKDDKFHFSIGVKAPIINSFIFNIKSDLKILDNRIIVSNMKIGSNSKIADISVTKYLMNVFNPLWVAQMILDQNNCKIMLKSVKITNGNIIISGAVFLGRS